MSDLVKKTKLNELEKKTADISSLATEIALIAVETKIPSVSSLVKKKKQKKTDYGTKISQLKRNLLIILTTNILQLHSLIP